MGGSRTNISSSCVCVCVGGGGGGWSDNAFCSFIQSSTLERQLDPREVQLSLEGGPYQIF